MDESQEEYQPKDESSFEQKLTNLINAECLENASNTPDFILAQYLLGCLKTFNVAVQQREGWYGRDPRPLRPFGVGIK